MTVFFPQDRNSNPSTRLYSTEYTNPVNGTPYGPEELQKYNDVFATNIPVWLDHGKHLVDPEDQGILKRIFLALKKSPCSPPDSSPNC